MGVPLATTTVTITKPAPGGDPYEDAARSTIVAGLRAHIGSPRGSEKRTGGSEELVDAVLLCDPIAGLDHYCTVTDDNTADTWQVDWVRSRRGLGLDHVRAGLLTVSGGSNG